MATPTPPRVPALMERVLSLGQAVKLGSGRSPQPALNRARQVVQQVDRRLAFSGGDTVIALAGATGSGKSSLFNAICGAEFAHTGVTRPTTDKAMAASWGGQAPDGLLDWLRVSQRHLLPDGDPRLLGLTLLDLPDHDSTRDDHRVEVDRLVEMVDGLVWVLDPQKYADDLVHRRYLRPYAKYADVMVIVLNHCDELRPSQLAEAMGDLKRLLAADGLSGARVFATSALTGEGLDALSAELGRMAKDKRLAAARLGLEVSRAAAGLAGELSRNRNRVVSAGDVGQLETALSAAAGVPEITQAALGTTRLRGAAATGWPLVSWINRLRPDPLRLLHLERLGAARASGGDAASTDVPVRAGSGAGQGVRQARVDTALRALADDVSGGLPVGWAQAVRQASLAHGDELGAELDEAVASTDLGLQRPCAWWTAVRVVQWVLVGGVVAGLLWLLLGPVLRFFQLPQIPMLRWSQIPVPTLLVLGCLVVGILVGLLARMGVELSARHRAMSAQAALMRRIGAVAQRCVVEPVNQELERYSGFVAAVAKAL